MAGRIEGRIKMKEKISIETITPEIAEKYLEDNYGKNRPLRQMVVNQYAEDMRTGNWIFNPTAPIAFSKDGYLLDGQHRLWACVQSGTEFTTLVVRNCDEQIYKVTDIGVARSTADIIGSEQRSGIAALAKYSGATRNGTANIGSVLSNAALYWKTTKNKSMWASISKKAIIDEGDTYREELLYCVRQGGRMFKTIGKWGGTPYAYFVWLVRWVGHDSLLEEFIDNFCDLSSSNTAVNVIRQKMLKRAGEKNYKTSRMWIVTALLYGYDSFLLNKPVRSLANMNKAIEIWNEYVDAKRKEGKKHE